ncbi:MAG: helix-turn-helix domain-containing protein [Desulfotomaculales bacterium]
MLGKNIRKLRRRQGLSLDEFARLTGFSAYYVSVVERGLKKPTSFFLSKVSEILNVRINYLESLEINVTSGKQLCELRESRGLTIHELSEISGVPPEIIKRVEAGEMALSGLEAKKLSEALNYPLEPQIVEVIPPDIDSLGKRIRKLRLQRGLSVTELARQAGVSPGLISQVERGYTIPLLDTLEAIAGILGVSLSFFLSKEESVQIFLKGLTEETKEVFCDPKVRSLLRALNDCNVKEFRYVLEFISMFIRQRRFKLLSCRSTLINDCSED